MSSVKDFHPFAPETVERPYPFSAAISPMRQALFYGD